MPKNGSFYLSSTPTTLRGDAKAEALIEEETMQRREDLIRGEFNQEEVKIICGIPLSRSGVLDKLIWHCNKDER